jgi:hypothetical protein
MADPTTTMSEPPIFFPRCGRAIQIVCFNVRMRSIQQSVQNGQVLCRLAQNASDLLLRPTPGRGEENRLSVGFS